MNGFTTKGSVLMVIKTWRLLPAYLIAMNSPNSKVILKDMYSWAENRNIGDIGKYRLFAYLMLNTESFRSVLYYRLGRKATMIKKLFRPMDSLVIGAGEIGPGLYIQHGFATIIAAKSVGENCWINQQVTIGFEQDRQPIIGNHVRICAGAIIIGDVTVGDNSIVAAGAVVTKNIPSGEVWGGNPAHFIKMVKGSSFDDQRG